MANISTTSFATSGASSRSKRKPPQRGPRTPSHAPLYPTKSWRPDLDPSDPECLPQAPGLKSSPLLNSSKPPSNSENQIRASSDVSANDEFVTSSSFDSRLQASTDLTPCTSRRPVIGDRVMSLFGEAFDHAGWVLQSGEVGTVSRVDDDGDFHLLNTVRRESDILYRTNFVYKEFSYDFKTSGLLPLFSRVDLMEMSTEQLYCELSITDDCLEQNMRRQNKTVNRRLRGTKEKLRMDTEWKLPPEERSKERAVPPPRWPDLGPSSVLSPSGGSRSSWLARSLSTPAIVAAGEKVVQAKVPASTYEPEELYGWMRSLYEPSRPQAVLRRVLAPLPAPPVPAKKVRASPSQSQQLSADLAAPITVTSAEPIASSTPPGEHSPGGTPAEAQARGSLGGRTPSNGVQKQAELKKAELKKETEEEVKEQLEEKKKEDVALVRHKAKQDLIAAVREGSLDDTLKRSTMKEDEMKAERVQAARAKAKKCLLDAAVAGTLPLCLKQSKMSEANNTRYNHLESMRLKRAQSLVQAYPEDVAYFDAELEQSANLDIDRNKCMVAWKRMSSGGELPTNELMALLSKAGQKRGDQTWIDDIMENKFCGRSTVDDEDFWQFIELYEARFKEYLETEFKKADADNSGTLSPIEMASLLRKLGFTPAPWTVQELMLELTSAGETMATRPMISKQLDSHNPETRSGLCRRGSSVGGLSLEQFMRLNDLMLQRAGFTKSEVMNFQAIFKRYDKSGDGEIDTKELTTALSWSGFSHTEEMIDALILEVDRDKSGTIDQGDFLTLMRKHREIEIDTLKSAFSASDTDHSGTVNMEELPQVFEELGYAAAMPAVFKDGIKACGLMPHKEGEYLFEDIWILLDWYRDRDGFSDEDLQQLRESFEKFDQEEQGESAGDLRIKSMDLGNAIRWMGYPQTFEELMDVIEEFDIDDDIGVDLGEFQKIMRYYREQFVNLVRAKFKERDADGSGSLSSAELKQVLLHLGYTPNQKQLKQMFKDLCRVSSEALSTAHNTGASLDLTGAPDHSDEEDTEKREEVGLWELEGLVRGFRREARDKFRKCHGFLEKEVTKYKHEFDKHDPQRDGLIDNKDLRNMLRKLFPNSDQDMNAHKKVKAAIAKVEGGEGGDGKLDFDEYLKLMRHLQDEVELTKFVREKDAVKDSKYSRKEVSDFRSIFQSFDNDNSGELSFDEFLILLSAILPPAIVNGAKIRPQLESMFEEVQCADEKGEMIVDFAGFLRLMRSIQDEDLGGINEILAGNNESPPESPTPA